MADLLKTKEQSTYLYSLNKKCLKKIFGYLEIRYGMALVKAFERKHCLDPIFRTTLNNKDFYADPGSEYSIEILQNYGPLLTDVWINGNVLFNTLAEFCVEGRLQKLELTHTLITDANMINRSNAMLTGLKSLQLTACETNDDILERLLAMCPNLETLSFEYLHGYTIKPLLNVTLVNIKSISLQADPPYIEKSRMIQLLTKYPYLRRFDYFENFDAISHCDVVCQMLPNLEEIWVKSDDIGHVTALKHLKKLEIDLHIDHLAEVNNYLKMSSGLHSLEITSETESTDRE